jgi:uncharacterized membrane protein YhaH (DUF805 family)
MNLGHILFSFTGRINRAKYWIGGLLLLFLCSVIIFGAMFGIFRDELLSEGPSGAFLALAVITMTVALFPALALGAKRLHDRGKSAWWLLLFYIVPGLIQWIGALFAGDAGSLVGGAIGSVISIWALVELGFLRGTDGPNQYGPDPLQENA